MRIPFASCLVLAACAVLGGAWGSPNAAQSDGGQERARIGIAQMLLPPYGEASGTDADDDGILDDAESALGQRFAPIVIHDKDDANLLVNVEWLLRCTSLEFYNNNGLFHQDDHIHMAGPPLHQTDLIGKNGAGPGAGVTSDGTRSGNSRRHTFALLDVGEDDKRGSLDSTDWDTYLHAFRNTNGGITLQYWRLYAFNTGDQASGVGAPEIDHHGGDWESVQVVLNAELTPIEFRFVGHTNIVPRPPMDVTMEGDHVLVFSEPGGHASHPKHNPSETIQLFGFEFRIWINDLNDRRKTIRQETWEGGHVAWPNDSWRGHPGGASTVPGRIINVGEKLRPLNGQVFVRYSGLWGSLGTNFSGYWGPAYNETEMTQGFITAWCAGMAGDPASDRIRQECHPAAHSE